MAKITVVDDSPSTVDMLTLILTSLGHTVSSHIDPIDVEERIAEEQPNLILMDIVMPQKSGYEVIRALRRKSETKDIPVIIVSNKTEETDIIWGKRQGAVEYITKPFNAETVMAAISDHL